LGFKKVLGYSKPQTFSTFLEKKKNEKCIYPLQAGHLKAEQNDRKVKRSKIKKKDLFQRSLTANKVKTKAPPKCLILQNYDFKQHHHPISPIILHINIHSQYDGMVTFVS